MGPDDFIRVQKMATRVVAPSDFTSHTCAKHRVPNTFNNIYWIPELAMSTTPLIRNKPIQLYSKFHMKGLLKYCPCFDFGPAFLQFYFGPPFFPIASKSATRVATLTSTIPIQDRIWKLTLCTHTHCVIVLLMRVVCTCGEKCVRRDVLVTCVRADDA